MREQRMCYTCEGKWSEDHECKNSCWVFFNPYDWDDGSDTEEDIEKAEGEIQPDTYFSWENGEIFEGLSFPEKLDDYKVFDLKLEQNLELGIGENLSPDSIVKFQDEEEQLDEVDSTYHQNHLDNDFSEFVDQVPQGCHLTIVSDSCQSGTLIDRSIEQLGESTKNNSPQVKSDSRCSLSFLKQTAKETLSIRGIYFGRHIDEEEDTRDDSGFEKPEDWGFMKDASPKVILDKLQNQERSGWFLGMVGGLAQLCSEAKLEENDEGYAKAVMELELRSKQEAYAGLGKRVLDDNGVLISGCQTDQTSADASPSGNAKEEYEALSHAIHTILAESEGGVTYYELVMKARKLLNKQGFTQRPGLYCEDHHKEGSVPILYSYHKLQEVNEVSVAVKNDEKMIHYSQNSVVDAEYEAIKNSFRFCYRFKGKVVTVDVYICVQLLKCKSKLTKSIMKNVICCGMKNEPREMQIFQFDPGKNLEF